MEELILRYYLKVFSIFLLIAVIFIIYNYYLFNKNFILKNNIINISKGETIIEVINKNIISINYIDIEIFKLNYKIQSFFYNRIIHHGDFSVKKKISLNELLKIISNPSNIIDKITIIEGWSEKDLNQELSKYFKNFKKIKYNEILADTYYFDKNKNFNYFHKSLIQNKEKYLNKLKNNKIFKKYSIEDILVIGSLIEKEGLDYLDKKKISSVIFNRLEKNMKLQIDATVIYSITDGEYNLNRKLTLNDLKIDHPYNTYKYKGLPPFPISYVGTKTIDIILENYNSDLLFYFFNSSMKKHVFSKNYEDHKKKLNEYRNKK